MPRERAHGDDEDRDRDEGASGTEGSAEPSPRLGPLIKTTEELTKEELNTAAEARAGDSADRVAVIVRVAEEDYVPSGVDVRARISPILFTAELTRQDIDRLQQDSKVVSIGTAKGIQPALE